MLNFMKQVFEQHLTMLILGLLLGVFYPILVPYFAKNTTIVESPIESTEKLFTKSQLALYDGTENSPGLYLSIFGSVYDVEKGKKHYGPGGPYSFFAARDASKSFITGEFKIITDDLDDVLQLESKDIQSLADWKSFYDTDYTYVGKLIGRFYNKKGQETEYMASVKEQIEIAKAEKAKNDEQKEMFPPCNIEWNVDTGTRVWCTSKSGGMDREWIGYPRKYFSPGSTEYRCACVHPDLLTLRNLKEFDNCDKDAAECFYQVD